jgi:hypothetical protein
VRSFEPMKDIRRRVREQEAELAERNKQATVQPAR